MAFKVALVTGGHKMADDGEMVMAGLLFTFTCMAFESAVLPQAFVYINVYRKFPVAFTVYEEELAKGILTPFFFH